METSEFYDYVGVAKDSVKQGIMRSAVIINWEIIYGVIQVDYFMSSWS